jgi:hypothetical protein
MKHYIPFVTLGTLGDLIRDGFPTFLFSVGCARGAFAFPPAIWTRCPAIRRHTPPNKALMPRRLLVTNRIIFSGHSIESYSAAFPPSGIALSLGINN